MTTIAFRDRRTYTARPYQLLQLQLRLAEFSRRRRPAEVLFDCAFDSPMARRSEPGPETRAIIASGQ